MFEAYKVGIRVSLINQASAGILALARHLKDTGQTAKELQLSLDKIKFTLLKGAALTAAGGLGLGLIGKTLGPAKEYAHQLQLMNTLGMKHAEVVGAINAAWGATGNTPTSSVAENLATIRELRMIFRGNMSEANAFMPVVQRLSAVLSTTLGQKGGDEAYAIAKALEMKGAVRDPRQFNTQADMMAKAIVASGGKISGSDFLSTFKYGRNATNGWNDVFAYTILPTLIQEMKSRGGNGGMGGPGNALMSAFAAVVGGTVPQKALKVWSSLGLLDPSKVVWNKVGSAKGLAPGGILGSGLFQANPFEWSQKVLLPALEKAGYKSPAQQREILQYLFPSRTAGFIMSQMVTQGWKFTGDQRVINQAQGLSAYNQLLKNDPNMAALALSKQWQSMLAILGFTIMPAVISSMTTLINIFRNMSAWAQRHHTITKTLMIAFAGLSAAMMFGGVVIMLTAAFRGLALLWIPMAAGIGLISAPVLATIAGVTALSLAIWYFWDRIKQFAAWLHLVSPSPSPITTHNKPGHYGSSGGWGGTQHVHVHIDGKEVAHSVVSRFEKWASVPPAHGSGFDGSMGLRSVAMPGS